MVMGWDDLAVAVAPSLVGGILGAAGQSNANSANIDQARENREWQAWMSNTAHQREVTDLKAAGLNPILSVNSGASSPGGAMATNQNVMAPIAEAGKQTSDMIFQRRMQNANIEALKIQNAKNLADTQSTLLGNQKQEVINSYLKKFDETFKSGAQSIKSLDLNFLKEMIQGDAKSQEKIIMDRASEEQDFKLRSEKFKKQYKELGRLK